jgi:hypothetical protein
MKTAADPDTNPHQATAAMRRRADPRGQVAWAIAGLVGFVAAFCYPLFARLGNTGSVWDWPEFLIRYWAAFHELRNFHQLPLWNPYACGGMPLLAHPNSQVLSPLFALALIFGPFNGLDLQVAADLAIAWSGGYVLARCLGMGTIGSLTCASIFPASSWFYLHIGVGHLNFLPSAYIPWVAAAVVIGSRGRSLKPWMLGGLLLAIMFGEGGVYQPTQAMILVTLLALWFAVARRSLRPAAGVLLMALFALGLAAIKLLPSIELMHLHPRPPQDLQSSTVGALLTGLFARDQFYDRPRIEAWGFWEVGAYLSPAAALLAVLGLSAAPRRAAPWAVAAALFFVLALGGARPWLPWALLHHLPVFSWERMPERFLIVFILAAGVIAGLGADFLSGLRKPFGAILAAMLLLAALADAWTVSQPNMHAPVAAQVAALAPAGRFAQRYDDPWNQVTLARSNLGALHCNEDLDFHEVSEKHTVLAANRAGYRGEYYLLGRGAIALHRWTPNALSYDVATPGANVVVINQNYDANWRLERGGGKVISHNGLLAVRGAAGAHHLRLVYRSRRLRLGGAISLLTWLLGAGLWIYERRRRGA